MEKRHLIFWAFFLLLTTAKVIFAQGSYKTTDAGIYITTTQSRTSSESMTIYIYVLNGVQYRSMVLKIVITNNDDSTHTDYFINKPAQPNELVEFKLKWSPRAPGYYSIEAWSKKQIIARPKPLLTKK